MQTYYPKDWILMSLELLKSPDTTWAVVPQLLCEQPVPFKGISYFSGIWIWPCWISSYFCYPIPPASVGHSGWHLSFWSNCLVLLIQSQLQTWWQRPPAAFLSLIKPLNRAGPSIDTWVVTVLWVECNEFIIQPVLSCLAVHTSRP